MFKPAAMSQVNIFALEKDVLNLTLALGQLGVLQLNPEEKEESWHVASESRWSDQADQYEQLKGDLEDIFKELDLEGEDEEPQLNDIKPADNEEMIENKIDEVGQKLDKWKTAYNSVSDKIDRLHLVEQEAKAISPLQIPIEKLRNLEHIHTLIGSIPKENFERLKMVLYRIPFVIIPIHEHEGWILILAASSQKNDAILDQALESALLDRLELPEGQRGLPEKVLTSVGKELEKSKEQLKELNQEKEKIIADHRDDLLEIWNQITYTTKVLRTISNYAIHENTYLISGWVPDEKLDKLVKTVDEVTEEKTNVEVLEASEDRSEVPSLLQNPGILRPFQNILSIFGYPSYNQLDPTIFVAITFLLMFGIMFGDVGHGLILAVIGFVLSRRKGTGLSSIAPVMIAAGISGMVFGFLFGSVFGREDILPHLWLSPIQDVTSILIFAIGGGALVLNIGFILHMVNAGRSKDWGDLFFSSNGLSGLAFYWAMGIAGIVLVQGGSLPVAALIAALIVPTLLILFREPIEQVLKGGKPVPETGWTNYIIHAFFEFFESVLGYFTNTISFVRLGAFAVAHAALGQVIFIMADLASGIWRWLIILIGTIIIVGFEGMVVGIQTLRLEYYEFFNKFYKGTGRVYDPFQLTKNKESSAG